MKKNHAILLALALAATLGIAACAGQATPTNTTEGSGEAENQMMGVPNPWTEYKALDEAEEAAGFDITAPETIKGYDEKLIQVMRVAGEDGKADEVMIEVRFIAGDEQINIRKAQNVEGDISGVYDDFTTASADVNGTTADVLTKDGTAYIINWTAGDFSYSVYASAGMSQAALVDIAAEVA